ncbi:MAG: colanic acid biosynthesis glycosyltransferase WcaL [Bacteroidetes bacterium]|nr:colanic acid biosynthesis glycosyltransferase WcaL [Bacteroidota bacterium]
MFDGGFADFKKLYKILDLSTEESKIEKLLYAVPKILSNIQCNKIQNFIEENQIQIAHFHYGTDCGVFFPFTKRINIPSVVSFYGYDCSSFPKFMMGNGKKYLSNRVFKRVTKVIAMSPDMKKDLLELGCPEEKIIVHYFGSDCKKFYLPQKQFDNKEIVTILNLGSLVPKKGQLFLLKSIAEIAKKGITNFRLRIIGTGILEKELKAYIHHHNLSRFVEFVGAIPYGNNELLREYHNADIFVHPSVIDSNGEKEGIPGTIVEAMSAALPVISTYHAGIPYIITNKVTGILVNEHDVEALTNALIELINNSELRKLIGLAGQRYAIENLDLIKKEIELEQIYQQIIL